MKKLILMLCVLGVFLTSGCVNTSQQDIFCKEHGYDGFGYSGISPFLEGWCYKIENDTLMKRYVVTHKRVTYWKDNVIG